MNSILRSESRLLGRPRKHAGRAACARPRGLWIAAACSPCRGEARTNLLRDRSQANAPARLHPLLSDEFRRLGIETAAILEERVDRQLEEIRKVDAIWCISGLVEEFYLPNEVSSETFFMVPLGVDYAKYNACETADARDDGFTTVFVGNVNPEKRVHLLAPGDPRPNDRRLSLFLLPSLHESFGLVALEAMAAGLPVIISDNVGSRDYVDVGVDGLIFEHGNTDALKDTINTFYREPRRAREFGRKSSAMAAEFDWSVAVGQLLKALKKNAGKS